MKSTLLFSLFPLLLSVAASPQGNLNAPGAARECLCPKDLFVPPCGGSACECRNNAIMACWLTRPLKCNVAFVNCPAAPITRNYPRCGQIGNPACTQGRFCRQVDGSCKPGLTGCVGVCVPQQQENYPQSPNPGYPSNYPPSQPQQPANSGAQPGWFGNGGKPAGGAPKGQQQPIPKAATCPKNYACPDSLLCVQDPHDALASLRGPTFKCVDGGPEATCAGFSDIQCQNGGLCIPDPRMECVGQGCTGICA